MVDFKKLLKEMKNQNQSSNKPAHTIRAGVLSVSIWRQDGSNGTFYRCNAQRAYKPDGEEEWKHTDSFGRDDLLIVAELMTTAWQWIRRAEAEAKKDDV
jgi:hypothetical protein